MKPTIVILHGWGMSAKRFDSLTQELRQRGHEVLAFDLPGFGESKSPVRPYALSDYAEYVHTYLEKEHILSPIFIGHSFGGRISLRYATLYPKSIRTLILTGTPGFTPVSRKKLLLFISIAKIGKSVLSLPTLNFLSETLRKWYYYLVGAKEFYRAEGTMRDTFKNVVAEPLLEDMQKISVPCLLLWGEKDMIVPVGIAIRMQQTIHGSILKIIEGFGHNVPNTASKLFVDEVEHFLLQS